MLVEILIIFIMIIVCFILYNLAKMSSLGWYPLHLVDNTNTLYLGDQYWYQTVLLFFRFSLFCVHQFAYVWVSLCVCGSVCNPSQGFKNPLLWVSQWILSQKMIKIYWLTFREWGSPLDNDPKLVVGQPNSI